MAVSPIQENIKRFSESLTELERIRLAQLRSVDDKGNLFLGKASEKEAAKRISKLRNLTSEEKQAVNVSLRQKLMHFQAGLSDDLMAQFLKELSPQDAKHMSSFDVCPSRGQ